MKNILIAAASLLVITVLHSQTISAQEQKNNSAQINQIEKAMVSRAISLICNGDLEGAKLLVEHLNVSSGNAEAKELYAMFQKDASITEGSPKLDIQKDWKKKNCPS